MSLEFAPFARFESYHQLVALRTNRRRCRCFHLRLVQVREGAGPVGTTAGSTARVGSIGVGLREEPQWRSFGKCL